MTAPDFSFTKTPAARQLMAALDTQARFVGGCVRDGLLGKPSKDIDVATPLPPETVINRLEGHNIRVIPTGLKHGTVTAVIGPKKYEVTTLRKDVVCDGRHAMVEFTDDWQADAARRDFTINALSLDADGVIHDYFGGKQDLELGKVRFIGDAKERIQEDYLRILRFFRFSVYYAKNLDKEGLTASAALAEGLDRLSGERIQAEMARILSASNPSEIIGAMIGAGIFDHLIPGTGHSIKDKPMTGLIRAEEIYAQIDPGFTPCPYIRLAYLLHLSFLGDSTAKAIAERWRLSRADAELLDFLIVTPLITPDLPVAEQKRLIREYGKPLFSKLLLLSSGLKGSETYASMLKLTMTWQLPIFPISGDDVLAQSIEPGKKVGESLKKLEEKWESSDYQLTREQLLDSIRSN